MMEPSNDEFKLFHRYNKLVRRDLVRPLRCSSCELPLTTGLGHDDELILRCLGCNTYLRPGVALTDRVRAVVSEHFMENDE